MDSNNINLSIDELLNKISDVTRIVDPLQKKVIEYKNNVEIVEEIRCFDFWGKNKVCDNCISIRAYNDNTTYVKIEYKNDKTYMITAVPYCFDDRRIVIEIVVAPDYRLSLDAPYPAALDDCHEALLWMKEHTGELGIRDDQLMVGGESAGGGLAAAIALYERDLGGVKIAFQMLLYPMLDDRMMNESAKENNAPVWDSDANRVAWGLYLADFAGKDVPPYAAPARATDFAGLPPTVAFVGDLEPFRDETILYVRNLRDAGVKVDFEIYAGCYHAFDRMNPYAEVSRKAIAFLMKSFKYAVEHYYA